jgi:PPP family 3-phenylpropionic acid transporter
MPLSFRDSLPVSFRLAFFYFAFFLYAGAYVAYFPPYLAARGLGPGEIAWVLALPHFARIFAPTAWGWLADRAGAHRGIVVFSCAANAACFALLPWAGGFAAIAALIAVTSLLSAAALPLVESIALRALAAQPGRYGPVRLWGSVSFVLAVMGGGAWLDWQPVQTLPGVLLAFCLLTVLAALPLPAQAAPARARAAVAGVGAAARTLFAAAFCMTVAHGALYAFLTLHLQALGYSGMMIGLLWTIGVAGEIVVFLYLPALFRRYALSTLLVASFACAVVRFLAIGWGAGELWLLAAAQLLHAATFGAFHAAAVAAVHRIFPEHAQGFGQTLYSSLAYGAGGTAGALLAGWAWSAAGAGLAFSACAAAAAAGLVLALQLKRHGY